MNEPIDWKARAEKAELELERTQKQFGTCSVCGFVAWKDKDSETEECQFCKVQRQAAEMRDALVLVREYFSKPPYEPISEICKAYENVCDKVERALSDATGHCYHHRDEYKELTEALNEAKSAIQRVAGINDENRLGWALQSIDKALTDARTKGLIA